MATTIISFGHLYGPAPTVASLLADQVSRHGRRAALSHRDLHIPVS